MKTYEAKSPIVEAFRDRALDCNPYFAETLESLFKMIYSYNNSRYTDGDKDANGERLYFQNLVDTPCWINTKLIEFDTKNIKILPEPGENPYDIYLLSIDFNQWMKEQHFGKFINRLSYWFPRYGNLYVKKVGESIELVSPRKLFYDPEASAIDKTVVVEEHDYSYAEFKQTAEEKNWNSDIVDSVLAELEKEKLDRVIVLEETDPIEKTLKIYTGDDQILDEATDYDFPYKHLKFEEVEGRLPGRGLIEKLFEEQIFGNESANYFKSGLKWTSLKVFQTDDPNIDNEIFTEADNGKVFSLNGSIQPVAFEERNLGGFNYADQKVSNSIENRTFSFESLKGQTAPAGTPFMSTRFLAEMASGFHQRHKENLALFVKEIIVDWVYPMFKKKRFDRHELIIDGDEDIINLFDNVVVNINMNKRIMNMLSKNGDFPSQEQICIMRGIEKEKLNQPNGRSIEVLENFYNNRKIRFDIDIIGESVDNGAKSEAANYIVQLSSTNPQIFQDKNMRKVISKALEGIGVNPMEFMPKFEDRGLTDAVANANLQRGGSISTRRPQQQANVTQTQQQV
jgi:hypothetical protein